MKRIALIAVLVLITLFNARAQDSKKENVKVGATLQSPRTTRIVNLLVDRPDVEQFADNFYSFYYRQTENNNKYLVEKQFISDTTQIYDDIYKIYAIEVRDLVIDETKHETIYIIPKY